MKKILACLFTIVLVGLSSFANATTVYFNSTECPLCVDTQAVVDNAWNSYGLTVSNAYWYQDSRDTFDGMGLSADSLNGQPPTISLAKISNNITMDYWVIQGHTGTYEAFGASNNLLGTLTVPATSTDLLGTYTFIGPVKSLEFLGDNGFTQISTLTFTQAVPEPSTYAMLLAGLGLIGFMVRRKNDSSDTPMAA